MTKAKQVLTADYDFSDEPLDITEIDGLESAIREVAQTKEKQLVRCDDRVSDYDVYWNSTTDTVRVGAVVLAASYEVPQEHIITEVEDDGSM